MRGIAIGGSRYRAQRPGSHCGVTLRCAERKTQAAAHRRHSMLASSGSKPLGAIPSSTNLGALELRPPMRRSAPCDADPAAPSADPSGARHSRISVGGESDIEQGAAGETEAAAESAVGEVEATRADMVSTLARDGEVAEVVPTPESSFSSPKPSPKGSSSHGQGRVLPHVLPNPHEATRERAVDELRGGA